MDSTPSGMVHAHELANMPDFSEVGFGVEVEGSFDEAIERVTAALRAEGFGVLTRIDLHRAFEDKLGLTFPSFAILGACNPALAHRAVTENRDVALLLPCNVTVEDIPGGARIRFLDPKVMMGAGQVGAADQIRMVAEEAQERLLRVADALDRPPERG